MDVESLLRMGYRVLDGGPMHRLGRLTGVAIVRPERVHAGVQRLRDRSPDAGRRPSAIDDVRDERWADT